MTYITKRMVQTGEVEKEETTLFSVYFSIVISQRLCCGILWQKEKKNRGESERKERDRESSNLD